MQRKQCVVLNGVRSELVWTTSEVPQGSVLGPLLFLVLMYDISYGINHATLSSFADDTKVWRGISVDFDTRLLQNDLNLIFNWADSNNMEFNTKKFQAIRFSPPEYTDSTGTTIQHGATVKDLGIHISIDLSFDHHIRIIAKRGRQMAGPSKCAAPETGRFWSPCSNSLFTTVSNTVVYFGARPPKISSTC